jgi:hypothetical protein
MSDEIENQKKKYHRLEESAFDVQRKQQARQVELQKALTPWPYMLEKKASDLPMFPTNSMISDLQTKSHQIFWLVETKSRYKDVPKLFNLFENHGCVKSKLRN